MLELKRYEEAIVAYDKAIELNPEYAAAYNNKGVSLAKSGRYAEAIHLYDKAIELNPEYTAAYNNKGNALHSHARYEEAIVAYDKAIELDPDYVGAYHQSSLYLSLKYKKKNELTALSCTINVFVKT